jgi:CubicO group peptidase (beta-lactamase class C family)
MIAERVAIKEELGFSEARARRIGTLMDAFIERGVIAGGVTLIGRHGQIAHLQAHGHMDVASATAMRPDALFRLASMTKPVISVAILLLLEEGKILLNDPVATFIPAFKDLQVEVANRQPAGAPSLLPAGGFHLEPAARAITIGDLLTHTSGLGSATVGPAAAQATTLLERRTASATLADVVPQMAGVPLSFQPGTAWEYSGAFGFDTLGHVVEIVSGLALDEFLQQRMFEPLGMASTTFTASAADLPRVATLYERGTDGLQAATPTGWVARMTDPNNRYFSGGGGLLGSAEDYSRFALMLASGGKLDGQRILSRKTVDLMASNHIGQLPYRTTIDMRGYRFGLGVRVLDNPAEATTLASRGTFGWAGAFSTNSWIDPVERMVGLLMLQRMPDPEDTVLRSLWPRFQTAAYQALDD